MKKRLVTTLLAGVMAASMVMPAIADQGIVPSADGTQVWAGIIIENMDAKVKVEVPTLFAFVVKGTTTASDTSAVTTASGNIYLPNYKVTVTNPSGGSGDPAYSLDTEGTLAVEGKLPITNYSTYLDGADRKGLEVKINGNIANEGDAASRKYWTHTTSGKTSNDKADFKNYNINIDGFPFDTVADGGLQMEYPLTLAAPDTDINGDLTYAGVDDDGHATIGETHYADFGVTVGGERGQYKQVEQSAKIGKIVWTVSVDVLDTAGITTAPDAGYLQP